MKHTHGNLINVYPDNVIALPFVTTLDAVVCYCELQCPVKKLGFLQGHRESSEERKDCF